jgi:hypothetical protein
VAARLRCKLLGIHFEKNLFGFNRQVYKLSGSLSDAGFVDSKRHDEMFSEAVSIQKVSELNV